MTDLYLDTNQSKNDNDDVGTKESMDESPNLSPVTVNKSPNFIVDVNADNPRADRDVDVQPPDITVQSDDVSNEKGKNLTSVAAAITTSSPPTNVVKEAGPLEDASGILHNNSVTGVADKVEEADKAVDDSTVSAAKQGTRSKVDEDEDDPEEEDLVITHETTVHSTPTQSVAGRTRQRSVRQGVAPVTALTAPSKTVIKPGCKPVLYGPPRTWSKGTPPNEKKKQVLKRKEFLRNLRNLRDSHGALSFGSSETSEGPSSVTKIISECESALTDLNRGLGILSTSIAREEGKKTST
ncbi:hypothetical protein TSUD_53020 [Trifolium subterraneum]|uniref:Uncharacterized protein n=1 Tax=Trifolium subterraneum TaxID=3900 RepID=A0A2Z6N0T8_TRISU|nr:hypothetical protein TSUD_53020 [Trifolium subterraneum]